MPPSTEQIPDLISTRDAALITGYTPGYISKLIKQGKLSAERAGHVWLVSRSELEKYFASVEAEREQRRQELSRERSLEYRAATATDRAPAATRTPQHRWYVVAAIVAVILIGVSASAAMLAARHDLSSAVAVAPGAASAAVEGSAPPAGSFVERIALDSYDFIARAFGAGLRAFALLFAPNPQLALDSVASSTLPAPPSATTPAIVTNVSTTRYLTPTFAIMGVDKNYVDARVDSLQNLMFANMGNLADHISHSTHSSSGGSGSVTSVDASGGTTGLTFTGGPITSAGTLTLDGVLATAAGGTGVAAAPAYGQLLLGNAVGGYDLVSTSTLGIAASGNPSWGGIIGTLSNQTDLQNALDAKFDASSFGTSFYSFFHATTTDALTQGATNKYYATNLFAADLAGTTTDALREGTNNLYWTNTRFDNRLSATTSLANLTTLANLSLPLTQTTGTLGVSRGGTGTTTGGVTNGIEYYDGTKLTNSSALTWDGSLFTSEGTINTPSSYQFNGSTVITVALGGTGGLAIGDIFSDFARTNLYGQGVKIETLMSNGVGISSTTPGSLLSIGSTNGINFSTATSTFSSTGGINLTAGCFAVGGTCIGTGGTGVTSLQQLGGGSAQTGAITFATSSDASTGLTSSLSITNTGGAFTFAPTLAGTLNVANGGTGTTTGGVTNGVEYYDGSKITNGSFFINTGSAVGIGTTTPFAPLSIMAGGDYGAHALSTVFAIGSSTAGTATSTLLKLTSDGKLTFGGVLQTIDTAASPFGIRVIGNLKISAGTASTDFTQQASAAGTPYSFNFPADSGMTAGVNGIGFNIIGAARKHLNGAVTLQSDVNITPSSYTFTSFNAGANIITNLASLTIGGTPVDGTNALVTNAHALLIQSSALDASTTNAYGLTVNAPTGAVNNYAGQFLGGNVGIGTTSPFAKLSVAGDIFANGNITGSNITATGTITSTGNITITGGALLSSGGCAIFSSSQFTSSCSIGGNVLQIGAQASGASLALYANNAEQARISSIGNLGIGTTSPFAKLSVAGDIFANGNITGSNITATGTVSAGSYAVNGTTVISASRLFRSANGTVSSPAFGFNTDGDTGIYSPGSNANVIGFVTGGVETGRFDATGNFGIGTTSPYGSLAVNGVTSATVPLLVLSQGSGQTSDYLSLYDSTGNKAVSINQFGNLVGAFSTLQFAAAQLQVQSGGTPAITLAGVYGGGQTANIVSIYQDDINVTDVINNRAQFAIGTSSTPWQLDVATSSTGALFNHGQLGLTDTSAGANLKHWLLSSEGGSFYISSSSDTFATSSIPALAIDANGNLSLARALTGANGGTGSTTLGGILAGNGTSGVKSVLIGAGLTFDGTTLSASGGSGGGTISTSSAETAGQLSYWTTTNGYPAKLGSIATTSATLGLGLSYSGTLGALVGGSSGSLTIATSSLYSGTTGQVAYFSGTNSLTGTSSLSIDTSGFVGVGTTTPSALFAVGGDSFIGGRLSVNADASTTGTTPVLRLGTTSLASPSAFGTFIGINAPNSFKGDIFNYQHNNTSVFTISDSFPTGGGVNLNFLGNTTASFTTTMNGGGNGFTFAPTNGNTLAAVMRIGNNSLTFSGQNSDILALAQSYGASSGSNTLNAIDVTSSLSQTGSANGITRGLYINPTITSATDFRAIETGAYTFNLAQSASTLRGSLFNAFTVASTSAASASNAYTAAISGAPIASTNVTISTSTGLAILGGAVNGGGTVTNGIGLLVNAPTGATNNYSALFMGGNVGIGTTSPSAALSVQGNALLSGTLSLPTLATPAGAFLAVNASGTVIATTSPSLSSLSGTLGIANGGTGTTTGGVTNGVEYYDGTNLTNGSALTWNGASLSANGFINTDQYSGYKQNGNLLAYASSTNGSTIFGLGAGGQSATTSASHSITAIGYQALNAATGYPNTAVGHQALKSNTTGSDNVAVGDQALYMNLDGFVNNAFGDQALYANTSGNFNAAFGTNALSSNTTGANSAAFGVNALQNNTSATSSTALGYQAGAGTGNYNNQGGTYIGMNAGLFAGINSDYNTLIGYKAGDDIRTGYDNILIGAEVNTGGSHLTTGANNICIGYNCILPGGTSANNQLNIGNVIFGTSLTATSSGTTIPSALTGNIGIGTTSPFATLSVAGNIFANSSITGSNITATGTVSIPALATPAGAFLAVNASGTIIATTTPVGGGGGVTSLQQLGGGSAQTGAITLATSSDSSTGLITQLSITNSGGAFTFAPSLSGTLNAANGGTGSTTLGGILVGNGTSALNSLTLPSFLSLSGNTLSLNGALGLANGGTGTTTFYAGGLVFGDGSKLTQSAAAGNFFWDETNKRLGLGTTTPQGPLAIQTATNAAGAFTIANSIGSTTLQVDTSDNSTSIFTVATSTGASYFDVGATNGALTFSTAAYASCTGLTTNSSGVVQCSVSDQRLKQNVISLDGATGLAAISALNPVSYTYIDPERPQGVQYGLIAQQVQQVLPALVATSSPTSLTPDGTLTVNYNGLFAPLIKSVQELDARTKALASSTPDSPSSGLEESLTNSIDALSSRVSVLEAAGFVLGTTSTSTPDTASWSDALQTAFTSALDSMSLALSSIQHMGSSLAASLGVFDTVFAGDVHTDKLCVGDTCVTQEQFLEMVQKSSIGSSTPVVEVPPVDDVTDSTSNSTSTTTGGTDMSVPDTSTSTTTDDGGGAATTTDSGDGAATTTDSGGGLAGGEVINADTTGDTSAGDSSQTSDSTDSGSGGDTGGTDAPAP